MVSASSISALPRLRWIAGAIALFLAGPLAASAPRIVLPAGNTLRPGQIITVGWENLPPRVEELEFFLIRAGYREEIVRLTPQLIPSAGQFRWEVPNLPGDGFLRLRIRIEDAGARNVADSAVFHIATTWRGEDPVVFRDGQWWVDPAARPESPRSMEDRVEPGPQFEGLVAIAPRRDWCSTTEIAAAIAVTPAGMALTRLPQSLRSRAPLVTPQRK
jgi:hypothetical protein